MSDLNGFTFKNYVSMIFVAFALFELVDFFFLKGGASSIEAMTIFLIIAVIFSYFRAFLVFVFYFFVVGLIVFVASMVIGYAIGINFSDIRISGMEFMYWGLGVLTAIVGISAFLTRRTREKEKEEDLRRQGYTTYERKTPNPDDFFDDGEERKEQEKREQEAYERGRKEAEKEGSKMSKEEAFEILGLKAGTSREEINQAYRKISKKIHPDATGVNTNRLMQKVNEAYEKLKGGDEK